jgi:hypothetical protein
LKFFGGELHTAFSRVVLRACAFLLFVRLRDAFVDNGEFLLGQRVMIA